nr:NADH dehydrogenase subunit 1 [Lamproglena orientalis]
MLWLDYILWIVFILLNVAFITLLERKVLSYSQNRLGPNKLSLMGILQPFSDAIKLFLKNISTPFSSVKTIYTVSPAAAMMLALMLWSINTHPNKIISSNITYMIFLGILSLSVYPPLMAGWVSNSKYAMIGAMRAIAQTISYEVILTLFLFMIIFYNLSMNLSPSAKEHMMMMILIINPILLMVWTMVMMAESNRTPFDFAEGESELVSGFNTEYSGPLFALIFMAEYAMIYFMSYFSITLFFSNSNLYMMVTASFIYIYIYIWFRATYPRHRYDMLMLKAWKSLLPMMLSMLALQMVLLSLIGS